MLGILPLWLADSGGCGAWPTKSVRNAAGSRYSVEQLGASCRGITARIDTGDQWGGGATQPPGSSLPPLTRLARSPGKLRIHASQVHSRLSRFINDRRYFLDQMQILSLSVAAASVYVSGYVPGCTMKQAWNRGLRIAMFRSECPSPPPPTPHPMS